MAGGGFGRDLVLVSLVRVKPRNKISEDSRVFDLQLDDAALRCCKTSIENGLEITRVERQKIAVSIECPFVLASANLNGSHLAGEGGTETRISQFILVWKHNPQGLSLVFHHTHLGGLRSRVEGSGSFLPTATRPSFGLFAISMTASCRQSAS